MKLTVSHRTIKIKKLIKADVDRVYKAFSKTSEKEKWSAPGGDEIKFLKSEFKNGGIEIFKCGPKGDLNFKGLIHYEDIVKNERIVYTETVSYKGDKLASALIAIELLKAGSDTTIMMTIQVASYCGEQMLKGCESGYKTSLKNLSAYLKR